MTTKPANQRLETHPQVENDEYEEEKSSVSHSTSAAAPKKRGRKLTEADKYREESNRKIENLKNDLKKKGLSVAQRQKIRNQISA